MASDAPCVGSSASSHDLRPLRGVANVGPVARLLGRPIVGPSYCLHSGPGPPPGRRCAQEAVQRVRDLEAIRYGQNRRAATMNRYRFTARPDLGTFPSGVVLFHVKQSAEEEFPKKSNAIVCRQRKECPRSGRGRCTFYSSIFRPGL